MANKRNAHSPFGFWLSLVGKGAKGALRATARCFVGTWLATGLVKWRANAAVVSNIHETKTPANFLSRKFPWSRYKTPSEVSLKAKPPGVRCLDWPSRKQTPGPRPYGPSPGVPESLLPLPVKSGKAVRLIWEPPEPTKGTSRASCLQRRHMSAIFDSCSLLSTAEEIYSIRLLRRCLRDSVRVDPKNLGGAWCRAVGEHAAERIVVCSVSGCHLPRQRGRPPRAIIIGGDALLKLYDFNPIGGDGFREWSSLPLSKRQRQLYVMTPRASSLLSGRLLRVASSLCSGSGKNGSRTTHGG